MRLLFLISHGLYLRNYGTLVAELARAGHEVVIAKTAAKEVDDTALRRIGNEVAGVNVVAPPERSAWWWASNDPLRAVRDYLRYLEPAYLDAPRLVGRAARRIPAPVKWLFERSGLAQLASVRGFIDSGLAAVERATPPDTALVAWLAEIRADAVLVTPLVDFDYVQLDHLKAARSLGVPTGLLVASWDNLTNKGRILIEPDLVTVWNHHQAREAREMHGVNPQRIVVTGAQLFDQWFTMRPGTSRENFCAAAGGLDPARPIILYMCSSSFICPDEVSIVRRWLLALRTSADPLVATANVIVRPHPSHATPWEAVELPQDGGIAAIYPRGGASPIDKVRQQDYYDNLYHAGAIVGVNTSGFLEAAIAGRRSLVLSLPETAPSQEGTLHFRYLLKGGFILRAGDMESHQAQLGQSLRQSGRIDPIVQAFVADFLRPNGVGDPALPKLVAAVTGLARRPYADVRPAPWWVPAVRALAVPLGLAIRGGYKRRLALRDASPPVAATGRESQYRAP